MHKLEGITISHYQIERQLARGGMSEIYLAKDLTADQMVALKMVHRSNHEYYERFLHEVIVISSLQHKYILPVIDYGEYEDWYYLVTPYIAHGTLCEHLILGELSVQEAGEILEQLTSALQYAHEQGIVHRDIKPSNVLLRDGKHVYLADFGLAKRVREDKCFTLNGIMMGTPEYIAPELTEEAASSRSDIYALGVLLYQMLTGKVPFSASTPLAILCKHVSEEPLRPSVHNATIPVSVEKVILRALEKNPHRRFSTAADMMDAYRQAMAVEASRLRVLEDRDTLDIPVYIKEPVVQIRQKRKRRSLTTLLAAGVVCLLLLSLSLNLTYYETAPQPASLLSSVGHVSTPSVISGNENPGIQGETPAVTVNQDANQGGDNHNPDLKQERGQKDSEVSYNQQLGNRWVPQPVKTLYTTNESKQGSYKNEKDDDDQDYNDNIDKNKCKDNNKNK